MSEIYHWEDLPKEITEDFVSIEGDYDFPFYISEKEEWVNYKYLGKKKGTFSKAFTNVKFTFCLYLNLFLYTF